MSLVNAFQARCFRWAVNTFGLDAVRQDERALRFVEEAIELAQVAHVPAEKVRDLVDHAYKKLPGDAFREAGQAACTLLSLCEAIGVSFEDAASRELARCEDMPPEYHRARWRTKIEAGLSAVEPGASVSGPLGDVSNLAALCGPMGRADPFEAPTATGQPWGAYEDSDDTEPETGAAIEWLGRRP